MKKEIKPHYRPSYCKLSGKRVFNVFKIRRECLKDWDGKHKGRAGKCVYCAYLGHKRWQIDRRKRK